MPSIYLHFRIKVLFRLGFFGLIACLFSPFSFGQDTLETNDGKVLNGLIWQWNPKTVSYLNANGDQQSFPTNTFKKLNLTLNKSGKFAHIKLRNENLKLVKLTAFKNDGLTFQNDKGVATTIKLSRVESITLYPVSKQQKELPFKYVRQKPDYCGEACVEMIGEFLGREISQDKVNEVAKLGGKRGCYSGELEKSIDDLNFKMLKRFYKGGSSTDYAADRIRLLKELNQNRPVLLGLWANYKKKHNADKWMFDHFVLLAGYDLKKRQFIIQDPGGRPDWKISFDKFTKHREGKFRGVYSLVFPMERIWTLKDQSKISGELLRVSDQVELKQNEKIGSYPLNKFNEADQKLLQSLK